MTVINTNVGALTARTYAVKATANTETAMERLSSGLRINSAADDAAGLAVANKMESQLRGMNMAIRNSQDGISLVQTAEAAMGEINNMAIRMRELAVQMNNGVYTDSDRANAQLEVTALLAEIDKIANNAAFNEVKILDGTYSQDIRAGNTNPEIINVAIDRMNTDSLGGANLAGTSSVATGNNSTDINHGGRTTVDVTEATEVTIKQTSLGSGLTAFASTYAVDGAYSLGSNAPAGWSISNSGEITKSNVAYDTNNSANNTVTLNVTYTGKASSGAATQTFTDTITVNIKDNESSAVVKAATSALRASESANISFRSVDSLNPGAATDGQLSNAMQTFVSADSYGGTWSLTGDDAADFTISASGVVESTVTDFENAADANTDNTYSFGVKYTSSTGDVFQETVTLEITNTQEETHRLTAVAALANADKHTHLSVTADGKTLTVELSADDASLSATEMASALNNANSLLTGANKLRGEFVGAGTNLDFVFNDSVGNFGGANISQLTHRVADNLGETDTALTATGAASGGRSAAVDAVAQVDTVTGISGVLNAAANGDSFAIDIGGTTITATVAGVVNPGDFSVADLASALNTANTAVAVTFGTNGADLTVTADVAGTAFTTNSFERTPSGGSAASVGSFSTTTANVVATNEFVVIDYNTLDGGTAIAAPTTKEAFITINGTQYGGDLAAGASNGAIIAAALNADAAFTAAGFVALASDDAGIAAADGNVDLRITQNTTAGTAGSFTVSDLFTRIKSGSGTAVGTVDNTSGNNSYLDGSNSLAYNGASPISGNRNATPQAATATLGGNFGVRTSTEVSEAKNTITLAEAATVKFGTDAMSSAMQNYTMTTGQTGGTYSLSGTDKASFEINSNTGLVENKVNMDFETKASYSFNVVYTDKNGDTFTDEVTLNLTDSTVDNVQHIADVNMSTQGGASSAIGILDSAINQISASQAKLGAIQNRLEHNIDNLSMASMLTETSKGRIIDADFAAETSELSKQQILAQAATSMLAQANQSKQSVLALLQ